MNETWLGVRKGIVSIEQSVAYTTLCESNQVSTIIEMTAFSKDHMALFGFLGWLEVMPDDSDVNDRQGVFAARRSAWR
jgi:hypothetical protein